MKLHCLLYFSQAATLSWFGEPLFEDRIVRGLECPIVPAVDEAMQAGRWAGWITGRELEPA